VTGATAASANPARREGHGRWSFGRCADWRPMRANPDAGAIVVKRFLSAPGHPS
jgi:hypothetical protein